MHVALASSAFGAAAVAAGPIAGAAYGGDAAVEDDGTAETVVTVAIAGILYVGLLVFRVLRAVLLRRIAPPVAAWSWAAWWGTNRGALPRPAFLPLLLRSILGRGTRQERMWQDWVRCALDMRDPSHRVADPEPPAPLAPAVGAGVVAVAAAAALPPPLSLLGMAGLCAAATWPMATRTVRALELERGVRASVAAAAD